MHARLSIKRYKGCVEDYLPIHDFLDSSKAHVPDMRHRAVFHHSFGIYIAEMTLGTYFVNTDGQQISTRDIAEEHVLEDLGRIPTVQDYLSGMPKYDWLGGMPGSSRKISLVD